MENIVLKQLVVLFVVIFLTGCATPHNMVLHPVSLLAAAKPHIESTRVIVGLDAKNSVNFIQQHNGSSGQQYGLLGVLIESMLVRSINEGVQDQERLMSPIRSAAIEYNFGSQFRKKIEDNLNGIDWLNISYVSKAPRFQRFQYKDLLKEAKESTVLVADSFYTMAADFSKITITSHVVMYPNNEALIGIAKSQLRSNAEPVLFQQTFSYEHVYEGVYSSAEEAARGWADNNGGMVARGLQTGVAGLANKIAQNIKQTWTIVGRNKE